MAADDDKKPPRPGRGLLKRSAIGAVLITLFSAGTVASAGLLEVDELITIVKSESAAIPGIEGALDDVDPGKPQTILVLGSDRRFQDVRDKNPVRSDTLLLVRLDPSKRATAVMSIPRDLKVDIRQRNGAVVTDKINAAYALGGPRLSVQTIRNLLHIPINHVVNVNFGGFRRAVNRLGCVYVDVDRDYFNDNNPPNGSQFDYATIDVNPGYQKLCGQDSLDFVRYRHFDDDFVRAARQQSFLAQAKEQIGLGRIFGDRKELLRIFGRYTQTDIARSNTAAILRLLKLAFESSKNPIREVHFRGDIGETYVTVTRVQPAAHGARVPQREGVERAARDARLEHVAQQRRLEQLELAAVAAQLALVVLQARPRRRQREGGGRELRRRRLDARALPGLLPRRAAGPRATHVRQAARLRHLRPRPPQAPRLPDRRGHRRAGPVLRRPGHRLAVAADRRQPDAHGARCAGARTSCSPTATACALVAWRTERGVYWVSNTLSRSLTNRQMLSISRSLSRIGSG